MATGGAEDSGSSDCVDDQVGGRRGHLCVPCSRSDRRTLATVFCKACNGHMCNDCCVKHITSAIGEHDIINIDNNQKMVFDGLKKLSIDGSGSRDVTRPARLKHLMTLDLVKTEGDEKLPFVTGMTFLPDGRLVAVDHKNKKCIVFDDKLIRKGVYNFEAAPRDVTCYDGDNIAVTLKYVHVHNLIDYCGGHELFIEYFVIIILLLI